LVVPGSPSVPVSSFPNKLAVVELELSPVIHGVIPNARVFTSGRRDLS
jgi:hypothetical protein